MKYSTASYIMHYGILGQKWGVRRYQNPDGSLTPEGRMRLQKSEYEIAKKSQTKLYRSDYDRMLDYSNKSKVVKEYSSKLSDSANKVKDLYSDLESYNYSEDKRWKIYELAAKMANEQMYKDTPNLDELYSEKDKDRLLEMYVYDGGFFDKVADQINKNDPGYSKLKKEYRSAVKEYKTKCKDLAEEIIGSYGDEKIGGLGSDMTYRELVHYAISHPNLMYTFTSDESMGRK